MSQIKSKFIASNAVDNTKLAQMPANTLKGNNTGSTANAADLTATQATAMLNPVVGDSGSGGTKGLVPAPSSGDAAAGKFLKADGTFAVPSGTGITQLTGDVTAGPGSGSQAATVVSVGGSTAANVHSAEQLANAATNANTVSTIVKRDSSGNFIAGTITASLTGHASLDLALTGGTMSGALNMGASQINNLATPSLSTDAATKAYVDNAINGLTWKGPVSALANSNTALTGGATLTIDGYAVSNGQYVILMNQTTSSQNNVYIASGIGTAYTLTVATGSEAVSAIGDAYLVSNGTVFGNTAYQVSALSPNTFIQFAGPNTYTFSSPLALTGNVVSLNTVPITKGGTGQITAAAAYNALSPMTTTGDLEYEASAGTAARLGIGSTGQILTVVGGVPAWAAAGTPTFSGLTTDGIMYATSASAIASTAAGTQYQVLQAGSGGVPVFGALNLAQTAAITGALPITNGGSGQITAQLAMNAFAGAVTSGFYLRGNGTNVVMAAIVAGDVPTLNQNTTGTAANITATSNSTLTTLSALSLPASQVVGGSSTEYIYTLLSADITAQYIDLPNAVSGSSASSNSVKLNVVGGPEQQKTVDYTVSLTGGSGGHTRISFAGDLATAGNAALVAGDILMVSYSY